MSITTATSSSPDPSCHRRGGLGKCFSLAAALLGLLFLTTFGSVQAAAPVEMEGELDVIIKEDFDRHHFEYDYFIRDETGKHWYQLEFERTPPGHLKSGQKIRVRGQPKGKKFQVESLEEDGSVDPQPAPGDNAAQALNVVDERRAVVLMVDLKDAKASSRYTLSQIAGLMFTNNRSVDGLYREASLGKMGFPADTDGDGKPDVYGPFAVDYDKSTCNYYTWATAAEAAATAAGIDLSLYRHRVFVLPRHSDLPACSWAGLADVGCGTFCRTWIAEAESLMVYAHELGHNLRMAHAGTDPENDGVINSEYGDASDTMGSSRSLHVFNAAHADQMGWYADIPGAITTVLRGGTYELAAIGTYPTTAGVPTALKISKPDTKDFYYLSYRQPTGYDASLSSTYTKGINIHRYKGTGYAYTTHIQTLSDGGAFNDPVNGINVYQVGRSGNYATVQVSFGCAPQPPKVALNPATQTLRPGSTASFTVSVTNQDSGGCGSGSFEVSEGGALPATVAPAYLTLSAGQTGTASLLADAAGALDGSFQVDAAVIPIGAEASSALASATVVVDGTPPSVPTGLKGSSDTKGTISLTWAVASDALSGVAGYSVYRDGALLAQVSTNGYKDSATVIGWTYQYSVSARDAAGNTSAASAPVAVTATGKTTGKPAK